MDSRIVVVGDRLYMIIAVAASEQARSPKTLKRVFDSFKLTAKGHLPEGLQGFRRSRQKLLIYLLASERSHCDRDARRPLI